MALDDLLLKALDDKTLLETAMGPKQLHIHFLKKSPDRLTRSVRDGAIVKVQTDLSKPTHSHPLSLLKPDAIYAITLHKQAGKDKCALIELSEGFLKDLMNRAPADHMVQINIVDGVRGPLRAEPAMLPLPEGCTEKMVQIVSPYGECQNLSFSSMFRKSCTVCRRPAESMLRCAGCKMQWYCSREHQKADWKAHKPECTARQTQKKRAAENAPGHGSVGTAASAAPGIACAGAGGTAAPGADAETDQG